MAHEHHVIINGKRYTPQEAARIQLPLDTVLRCPCCNGGHVEAVDALTGVRFPDEIRFFIPRQQDRWCLDCGHRWMTVLPPEAFSSPIAGGSR